MGRVIRVVVGGLWGKEEKVGKYRCLRPFSTFCHSFSDQLLQLVAEEKNWWKGQKGGKANIEKSNWRSFFVPVSHVELL